MSILFLLKSFGLGGVEVITTVLANKFVKEGHRVFVLAFEDSDSSIIDRFDKKITTHRLSGFKASKENVFALRRVLAEEHIEVVINQWGLPIVPIRVARKAARGLNVKFVSVFHNTPDMNGRIQTVQQEIDRCASSLKRIVLIVKRAAFKAITSASMRYNYRMSDAFMVLSPSFVDIFKGFTGIKNPQKLLVQTNPVTIDSSGYEYNQSQKRKEVVYVGRLDNMQKRTMRLIDVWEQVEPQHSDWKLTIVGVGPDTEELKKYADSLELKNVSFEGYQHPRSYYERASILLLTSEFEGFPLVLAECMSFGVVPVVYNSYAAAGDIIKNEVNGRLVEKVNGEFSAKAFAEVLSEIMKNDDGRDSMAREAIKTAKEYSVETIYEQWMKLMKN